MLLPSPSVSILSEKAYLSSVVVSFILPLVKVSGLCWATHEGQKVLVWMSGWHVKD